MKTLLLPLLFCCSGTDEALPLLAKRMREREREGNDQIEEEGKGKREEGQRTAHRWKTKAVS